MRYEVEAETLDAQVPNLILQPLVENSVRHAVAVRIEPGLIEIRRAPGGHEPGTVGARQRPGPVQEPGTHAGKKGVGLANTRSRLEHLYGASQQLSLEEPPGGGLIVTVMLPFRDETDVAEIVEAEEFTEDIKGVA